MTIQAASCGETMQKATEDVEQLSANKSGHISFSVASLLADTRPPRARSPAAPQTPPGVSSEEEFDSNQEDSIVDVEDLNPEGEGLADGEGLGRESLNRGPIRPTPFSAIAAAVYQAAHPSWPPQGLVNPFGGGGPIFQGGSPFGMPMNAVPAVINTVPEIEFYFINKHCPIDGIRVHPEDTKRIRELGFSEEKPTMFIIHGWTDKQNGQVIGTIAKAALAALDLNIIAVDWSKILQKTYLEAVPFVPKIGRLVGEFLDILERDLCLDLASTTVVGHSLGAHVAGIACAYVGSECDLIVGLDPTFSLFPLDKKDNRLDSSDAEFVQVIHTSCGLLGFEWPIGHADYYPNGGKEQPGCLLDLLGICRHARSYLYYAESLVTGHFKAHECANYLEYLTGKCNNKHESYMGQYYIDRCARGSYFFKTHEYSPFAWI